MRVSPAIHRNFLSLGQMARPIFEQADSQVLVDAGNAFAVVMRFHGDRRQ
jgi:hypothetical protein